LRGSRPSRRSSSSSRPSGPGADGALEQTSGRSSDATDDRLYIEIGCDLRFMARILLRHSRYLHRSVTLRFLASSAWAINHPRKIR
jgi:hypothetical protein